MLVRLYDLPDHSPVLRTLRGKGIAIRRAIAPEKTLVAGWVLETFGRGWADECEKSFANTPVTCYIAVQDQRCAGFCCYEATCRDFLGPLGVSEELRGKGVGTALVWSSLVSMREMGYGYAVIGGAGPREFYERCAGAVAIPDSSPGIYEGMLRT